MPSCCAQQHSVCGAYRELLSWPRAWEPLAQGMGAPGHRAPTVHGRKGRNASCAVPYGLLY